MIYNSYRWLYVSLWVCDRTEIHERERCKAYSGNWKDAERIDGSKEPNFCGFKEEDLHKRFPTVHECFRCSLGSISNSVGWVHNRSRHVKSYPVHIVKLFSKRTFLKQTFSQWLNRPLLLIVLHLRLTGRAIESS